MKILVLSDNFGPEIAASSFRIRDHAQEWLKQGHEVTVVTCVPNWPAGKVFPGYKNRPYQQEWIDGVRVIRLWSYISANEGFFKRTLDYFSYALSVTAFAWKYPRFDVILATSPQFFTALAGWWLSILRRKPWVFELRDLWPESIKAVGAAKGFKISLLERLEKLLYRRASRIIALTLSFKQNLRERGIDVSKVDVVTNGVDLARFNPGCAKKDARRRLNIPADAFVTGYVGTTGMAHGLETVLDAAALCRTHARLHFVILGDGAKRRELEAYANAQDLKNVSFLDRVPQEQLPEYLTAFDLPIIHLLPNPTFRTVIPSKLFEFMAMERPVIMAVEGEAAEIVKAAECGVCVPSGDASAIARQVIDLSSQPAKLRQMGLRGRQAVTVQFQRVTNADWALVSLQLAMERKHDVPLITPYEQSQRTRQLDCSAPEDASPAIQATVSKVA